MQKKEKKERNNFYPKLISFITAIFLFIFIDNVRNIDKTLTLPLYLINVPANSNLINHKKQIVYVKIKGDKDIINSISTKNISAVEDMSTVTEGTNLIKIKIHRQKLKSSISVISYKPKKSIVVKSSNKLIFLNKEDLAYDQIRR